ncbi:hypothetical protein I316_05913 [Kwoniella heveanensis BCC8398]|uniref:Xylanolytic transcriptional activator regulatory domain-containing protein n=1 Tax=Kwoniella heveanensis BCC8398 TaxID=1296120 RepID=A0A1B9GNV8_9TREE|nr:hypothetical protein I316_05913 [Kwoniella heveanensis BCC8398]
MGTDSQGGDPQDTERPMAGHTITSGAVPAGPTEMTTSPLSSIDPTAQYNSSWPPASVPTQATCVSSESHVMKDLVKVYFASVHHFAYLSFVHEPDFWELFERGRAPQGLTTLMAALALRFGWQGCEPSRLKLADQWASDVSDSLIRRIFDEFGAVELMEVVLCQTYNFLSGRYSQGMVMAGMAVRMMTFLRLNELDQWPRQANKPLIHRESLRRLAWSVWFLDATLDGGNFGASTIHDESFTIQLPFDDRPFLQHKHVVTEPLVPPPRTPGNPVSSDSLDLSAHLIRAMYARQVLAQTQSRIQKRIIPLEATGDWVKTAEEKAEMLLESMPSDLQYNRSLFLVFRDRHPTIVCLHMVRNNCQRHRSLLRMLYEQQTSSQTYDIRAERICLIECARSCSRILQDALEYNIPLDPQIGMHAYNAIEILLFQPGRLYTEEHIVDVIPRQEVLTHLKPLIEVIRLLAPICPLVALIYPEAINRMIQMGYVDELSNNDVMAVLQKVHCVDHATQEFDWTESFWRYEMFLSRRARATALAAVINNAPPGTSSQNGQDTESPENALLEDALQEVPSIPASSQAPITPLLHGILPEFAWDSSVPGLTNGNQSTHEVIGLTELMESTEWSQPLPPGEVHTVNDPLSRLHDLFEIRTNQNSPSQPYRDTPFNIVEADHSDFLSPSGQA